MIEVVSLSWMLHNKNLLFLGLYQNECGNKGIFLDLLCEFTLQIIENCIKLLGFFSLCFNL